MPPRFAWLGSTRRRSVRDAIASCIDAWLRDWCLQREALTVEVLETAAASWSPQETLAWLCETERGCVLSAISTQQLEAMGRRLAAVAADDDQEIVGEVARNALQDLVVGVAARARQVDVVPELGKDTWPERITRPAWGALAIQIELDGIAILIAMDRAVVDALCPKRVRDAVALSDRADALESTTVSLTALLDFGEINVRDLAGLRIGEVLISERKLGQPVGLRIGDHCIADAALGRIGTHLAAVVAAPVSFQEQS